MIINGLTLLLVTVVIVGFFYAWSKVNVLKFERNMWKESTFAITEMYNNLALENRIEKELHDIGKNNLPLPKRFIN